MIQNVVQLIADGVSAASNFMIETFNATGTFSLVIASITVVIIMRYVVGPITGFRGFPDGPISAGSSDTVCKQGSARRGSSDNMRSNGFSNGGDL